MTYSPPSLPCHRVHTPRAQDIRIVTLDDEVTYVEVKSTSMVSKPFFEISMQELLFSHSKIEMKSA